MRAGWVLAACLLLGVTGCSGPVARQPDPFPPRPHVLDVARVDPCAGLDDRQRAELDLRPGRPGVAQGGTSRVCSWSGNDGVGYNLQTLAADATTAIGAEPTSTVVTVAGFGAVQSSPPAQGTGLPFCQVVLDVADGASLRAQLQVSPLAADAGQRTVDDTCRRVRDAAVLMLDNLRARQA